MRSENIFNFNDIKNQSATHIRQFIEANVPSINYTNEAGLTMLHLTAEYDENVEVAKVLISMGANVNAKEQSGLSPLHIAVTYGNIKVAEILISNGANVNAKEDNGMTPLHIAAVAKNTAAGRNVEIAKILIHHGANVNAKSNVNSNGESYTPLDLANQMGDTAMAQYLNSNPQRGFMSQEKLFAEFPDVSTEEWESTIQADLKGADYEKKLVWKTLEGIAVKPYYRKSDTDGISWLLNNLPGEFPFVRGTKKTDNDWEIREDIYEQDIAAANSAAKHALERGAEALSFKSRICGKCGVIRGQNVQSQDDFNALLNGIDLSKIPVYFNFGTRALQALEMLSKCSKSAKGGIIYDPLAELAQRGKISVAKDAILKEAAKAAAFAVKNLPAVNAITVQSHPYHNAGANIIQELSIALSAGLEYMNALTDEGLTAEQAASQITFSFSVGSRYFLEIAKIRAFRVLWANILKKYGVTGTAKIHASTSMWNSTVFDPNVNMLRVTTEAMSAAIAGADSITVIPYDAAFKTPDEFSCRIARNVQLLLKNESRFNKIIDPAAGSYYVESLTDQIASKSLEAFKKIESQGGLLAALLSGSVQKELAETQKQKEKLIMQRREVFIGTNQYPNLLEKMSDKIKKTDDSSKTEGGEGTTVEKLSIRRGAEVFEKLRLQTEEYAKKTGSAPKVFLWTAGDLAMRLARATFIKNFFGCAGYTVIDTNGIPSAQEGIELVKKNTPQIVVLCSKDDEYLELAKEIFPALEKEFPNIIRIVAGNPKEAEELKAAGAQDFIHILTNAIESLSSYQKKLGVA
ncbi:MAG: methylmalonyl-CoA mutase family protein [Fibromonadaceae bacterium]|nr:methylmalonyl-CoA mutase family protein [Fibromonadaceae bacterium]